MSPNYCVSATLSVSLAIWAAIVPAFADNPPTTAHPFRIKVVDSRTGRGVPLVELTTVNGIPHITDSAGVIAFDEPGLMNDEVFFSIRSHGYLYPKDGFGNAGLRLRPTPDGSTTVRVDRVNIAQRLYRITGQGIYHDSVILGDKPPIAQPLLCGKVLGQDSVQTALYRGKIYWFYGDTGLVLQKEQNEQIAKGLMKPDEALVQLRDADSGKAVLGHSGNVAWNAYRGQWIMIVQEGWGASMCGEVWFAEAPSLVGPWGRARKIITHDDYSFYNVAHHPFFDQEGGRIIYLEGTYTMAFSGTKTPTPRYDYNQIMYSLDQADSRLKLK